MLYYDFTGKNERERGREMADDEDVDMQDRDNGETRTRDNEARGLRSSEEIETAEKELANRRARRKRRLEILREVRLAAKEARLDRLR